MGDNNDGPAALTQLHCRPSKPVGDICARLPAGEGVIPPEADLGALTLADGSALESTPMALTQQRRSLDREPGYSRDNFRGVERALQV
ncbi:hypothetical protein R4P08_17265 [Rhodococcus sp. IEGM 1408]|nr:hypothetical protein [Rhodococcus sp. IEGM 1408]MDV8002984.1 hypothetical protein [Rhodococcus sp. IEGM 1408]